MSGTQQLGSLIQSFFIDHLVTVKGLRPSSVRSYSDTIRLLLCFIAEQKGTRITKLALEDLSFGHVIGFLRYLEDDRHNGVSTRNQRLAALHCLFEYIASREPAMLETCQRVAAIPMKRTPPAETHFLERDEMQGLLQHLPRTGRLAQRNHALILFLYNTGARAQEVAELRAGNLQLGEHAIVRLHGKGDKWRTCPLWDQTAKQLTVLLDSPGSPYIWASRRPSISRIILSWRRSKFSHVSELNGSSSSFPMTGAGAGPDGWAYSDDAKDKGCQSTMTLPLKPLASGFHERVSGWRH
ncbi:tyrosine-type recombinase/integrase [Paeniglutamicibacter antarcticus]|uniref:Tyrosine-type recombinase/integrase n=1 Tax=Arthrobacter terrae TaxID=2935737 RepID=A0A931CUX0_9MICC|nr:tyrosine-type recombinase/integrase [Arthrobacter terrae]